MSSDIMAMPCYYFPSTLLSHGVIVLGLPMPHRSNGWINGIFLLDYGREEQCTLHLKTSLNLRWQMVSSNHQHFEYEKSYITSQMNTYKRCCYNHSVCKPIFIQERYCSLFESNQFEIICIYTFSFALTD